MATNDELGGLLGDSGFLEALYLAEQSSRLDISVKRSFGCNPVAWYSYRYPLCRCQLARLEHIPLRFPKDLRRQACCDWWLGKSLQGKEKGIDYFFSSFFWILQILHGFFQVNCQMVSKGIFISMTDWHVLRELSHLMILIEVVMIIFVALKLIWKWLDGTLKFVANVAF
jgi:hypothetical protein